MNHITHHNDPKMVTTVHSYPPEDGISREGRPVATFSSISLPCTHSDRRNRYQMFDINLIWAIWFRFHTILRFRTGGHQCWP